MGRACGNKNANKAAAAAAAAWLDGAIGRPCGPWPGPEADRGSAMHRRPQSAFSRRRRALPQ